MPAPLQPRQYRLGDCPRACSLNERNLPAGAAEAIHRWYEQGSNADTIVNNAKAMGWEIKRTAVFNHKRKHMIPEDHFTPLDPRGDQVVLDPATGSEKLSDLQILDKIIAAGAKQLNGATIRISPEMTMKAMELRLKLTQGSVFDDFMDAVGKAFGAPDTGPGDVPEAPEAVADEDEAAQGATDDPGGE